MTILDHVVNLSLAVALIIGTYQFYFWCQRKIRTRARSLDQRPRDIDPILGLLPAALASPLTAAFAFSVLATTTSFAAAAWEHRLIGTTRILWGKHPLIVHPFIENVSTIVDFAILCPSVIYFVYRSRCFVLAEPLLAPADDVGDRLLRWFTSVSCLALAVIIMSAYFLSFSSGQFYDAVIAVSEQGIPNVTFTGWVVFIWTALFIYVVLMGALNQVSYVVRVCRLKTARVSYDPLHEDGAAGLHTLATPAIEFTKASLLLLVIGIVFWAYDRIMMKSPLTDRTASIAIFTGIVLPLFAIPIGRLHFLMCELRASLLRSILGGGRQDLQRNGVSPARRRGYRTGMLRLADDIEATEKLRSVVLSLPTWPMSTRTLVSCGAFFASISTPVITKLIPVISSALGIATK